MSDAVLHQVRWVRRQALGQALGQGAARAALLAAPVWAAGMIASRSVWLGLAELALAAAVGALHSWRRVPSLRAAASLADRALELEDRLITAIDRLGDPAPMAVVQRADAGRRLAAADTSSLRTRWPVATGAALALIIGGALAWRAFVPRGGERIVQVRTVPLSSEGSAAAAGAAKAENDGAGAPAYATGKAPAAKGTPPEAQAGQGPGALVPAEPNAKPNAGTAPDAARREGGGAGGGGKGAGAGSAAAADAEKGRSLEPPPPARGAGGRLALRRGGGGSADPNAAEAQDGQGGAVVGSSGRPTELPGMALPERYRPVIERYVRGVGPAQEGP